MRWYSRLVFKSLHMSIKGVWATWISIASILFIAAEGSAKKSSFPEQRIDSLNQVIKQNGHCVDTSCFEAKLEKADACFEAGALDSSEVLYLNVMQSFKKVPHQLLTKRHLHLKSLGYYSLGKLYNRSVKFGEAKEYYQKSYSLCEELQDANGMVVNLNNLMMLPPEQTSDSLAQTYVQIAHSLRPKELDLLRTGVNWQTIGHYHKDYSRNLDSSLFWELKALRIFEQIEEPEYIAKSNQRVGRLHLLKDQLTDAIRYLYKALEIEEQLKSVPGIISARLTLANLYTHESDHSKSLELLSPALELCRVHRFFNKQANILVQMGINSWQLNKLDSAQEFLMESLQIVEEYQLSSSSKAIVYAQLGIVAGKKGNLEKALEYALNALKFGHKSSQQLIYQYIHISSIYAQMGKSNMAEQYALKGLATAQKLGSPMERRETLRKVYELYENGGKYEEALRYLKMANTLKDSMQDLDGHKALAKREAEYQIAKKEQELVLEKRTTALLQEEQKVQRYMMLGLFMLFTVGLLAFWNFYQRKKLLSLEANNKIMRQLREIDGLKSRLENVAVVHNEPINGSGHINEYLQTSLSQRELEVLEELMKGKSNKDISDALCISINTVTTHLKKIYTKLEVGNRTQAAKKAAELTR